MLPTSSSEQVTSANGSLVFAHLSDWLAQHQLSLGLTTYQSNELLLAHRSILENLLMAHDSFDKTTGL